MRKRWGRLFAAVAIVLCTALAAGCAKSGTGSAMPTSSAPGQASTTVEDDPSTSTSTSPSTSTSTAPVERVASSIVGTMTFEGVKRSYEVYIPTSAAGTQDAMLVVGLHGGGGSAKQFADSSRLREKADSEGFVLLLPDGTLGKPITLNREIRTWNSGRCCGPAARDQVDDVGFLTEMVRSVQAEQGIDRNHTAFVGHSNGAMMTWRMACERSDLFAAAVVVAGSDELTDLDSCQPQQGVFLDVIHGDADVNHPIDGGKGNGLAGVSFRSVADSLEQWVGVQRCDPTSAESKAGALTTTIWTDCANGTNTKLVVIAGAEHAWPGASGTGATAGLAGTPTDELNATDAAWEYISMSLG